MNWFDAGKHFGAFGAFVGLICGILYSGIGFVIDASTGNLGVGTALAFLALLGMPAIGAACGAAAGILYVPIQNRCSKRF